MAQHRILIADDSRTILAMLSRTIQSAGYDVITASDGVEAVQAVHARSPELVLLDIHMPRLNGYQVCRLIKNDPHTAHLPVIMLTASENRNDEFWSLQTGADRFLSKGGYKLNELLDMLVALLPATVTPEHPQPEPSAEDILSHLNALADRELYRTSVEQIRHRLVWELVDTGLLAIDGQHVVHDVNEAALRLLAKTPAQVQGQHVALALEGALYELVRGVLDTHEPGTSALQLPGGAAQATVTPLTDHVGEPAGALCLLARSCA